MGANNPWRGTPYRVCHQPHAVRGGLEAAPGQTTTPVTRNPKLSLLAVADLQRTFLDNSHSTSCVQQPETRNSETETRNPGPETRTPNPETQNPEPETRNAQVAVAGLIGMVIGRELA